MRKNGDISIYDADNTLEACKALRRVNTPLKMVVIVPRKKLDCDDNYSEDVIAQTIIRVLITKSADFKVALKARQARINVDSYSTDSIAIMSGEYSNFGKKEIGRAHV